MPLKDYDLDIWILGCLLKHHGQRMHNTEIVNDLWKRWCREKQKDLGTHQAFKKKVTLRLLSLAESKDIKRFAIGHKNVSYTLLPKGARRLDIDSVFSIVKDTPPILLQALLFLDDLLISECYFQKSPEATLEDYIRIVRNHLNSEDIASLVKKWTEKRKLSEISEDV